MSTTSAHQPPTPLVGDPAAGLADGGHDTIVHRDAAAGAAAADDTTTAATYTIAHTRRVAAANGIVYAHRDIGESQIPVVLLQHFRGNLDNWDPALVDALATHRRVVTFDNVGVAATTGTTPATVEEMARGALDFLDAIDCDRVDLLGFSLGSFVAQEIALIRPALVRKLVLASSAPRGAAGMHGWSDDVMVAVGAPTPSPEGVLDVFFTPTDAGRQAGADVFARIFARTDDRDEPTTWQTRQAQYDAVCTWGIPNAADLERLAAIDMPVLVANGDSDRMILPSYSHLLAELLPNARLQIYPDSAHGFLFQHHSAFASDVNEFLDT